ncbi:hypothetical protein FA10DRAFT_265236 [Acaromyces ingoldii]|uniref:Uncharacterized protein n=1 Tax=Acaromyces ingoldii TaxID=215250 RepID=A0A316YUI8_9BASI|nr:hypothetical protein FA10DRAFT_265236 [Acaromyces ingoldii]PWN91375.1 hypothetical protein FA10DRAFT_265236 [Acaromyces ingoldii]
MRLPLEILERIIDQLIDELPEVNRGLALVFNTSRSNVEAFASVRALAQTSSWIRHRCLSRLWRNVSLYNITNVMRMHRLFELAKSSGGPVYFSHIRNLELEWKSVYESACDGEMLMDGCDVGDAFLSHLELYATVLLERCTNLRRLLWCSQPWPMPKAIAARLDSMPSFRELTIEDEECHGDPEYSAVSFCSSHLERLIFRTSVYLEAPGQEPDWLSHSSCTKYGVSVRPLEAEDNCEPGTTSDACLRWTVQAILDAASKGSLRRIGFKRNQVLIMRRLLPLLLSLEVEADRMKWSDEVPDHQATLACVRALTFLRGQLLQCSNTEEMRRRARAIAENGDLSLDSDEADLKSIENLPEGFAIPPYAQWILDDEVLCISVARALGLTPPANNGPLVLFPVTASSLPLKAQIASPSSASIPGITT